MRSSLAADSVECWRFVEKERSAIGKFEPSSTFRLRIRECATYVTEHFAFKNSFGESSNIDCNDRLGTPVRNRVKCLCHDLLAGAVFTRN